MRRSCVCGLRERFQEGKAVDYSSKGPSVHGEVATNGGVKFGAEKKRVLVGVPWQREFELGIDDEAAWSG